MADQIIDTAAAQGSHAYADRTFPMVGWIVMQSLRDYPGKTVARLVTKNQTAYVLIGNTLSEIHAQLPPDLVYMERRPSDPSEIVEVWFAGPAAHKDGHCRSAPLSP